MHTDNELEIRTEMMGLSMRNLSEAHNPCALHGSFTEDRTKHTEMQWDILEDTCIKLCSADKSSVLWAMPVYRSSHAVTTDEIKVQTNAIVEMAREWLETRHGENDRNFSAHDWNKLSLYSIISCKCAHYPPGRATIDEFLHLLSEWFMGAKNIGSHCTWHATVERGFMKWSSFELDGTCMGVFMICRRNTCCDEKTCSACANDIASLVKEWGMQQIVLETKQSRQKNQEQINANTYAFERAKYFTYSKDSAIHVAAAVRYAQRSNIADAIRTPISVDMIAREVRDWLSNMWEKSPSHQVHMSEKQFVK